jgi:hypothetical protein
MSHKKCDSTDKYEIRTTSVISIIVAALKNMYTDFQLIEEITID